MVWKTALAAASVTLTGKTGKTVKTVPSDLKGKNLDHRHAHGNKTKKETNTCE